MDRRQELQRMLDLAITMWEDPLVYCYQNLDLAPRGVPSIFLVGPSSRQDILEFKWRVFAAHYLRKFGFDGVIYIPEPRNDDWSFKETFPMEIVDWEIERVLSCALVISWLCRHSVQLPGRVTGVENAFLSGMAYVAPEKFKERLIFGHPQDAWKVKSDVHWTAMADIKPFHNLEEMCKIACERI